MPSRPPYVTQIELDWLKHEGAISWSYMILRSKDYWGRPVETPWRYIIHFWNADGVELAMVGCFGAGLQFFDKPRVWDQKIKDFQQFARLV